MATVRGQAGQERGVVTLLLGHMFQSMMSRAATSTYCDLQTQSLREYVCFLEYQEKMHF